MPILQWLTRDQDVRSASLVPHRLLLDDRASSYGAVSENLLIQGDNLEALKALLPFYAGKIRCIYIDPPYNTGSAFSHYDDALEHSKWLSVLYPRMELLRQLLDPDLGTIWVSIDDDECHYLKVLMDEVFTRKNFIADVIWQKRTSPDGRINLGDAHDHILVYGSQNARDKLNLVPLTGRQREAYKNPDKDLRGPWVSTDFTAQGYRPNQMYQIITPSGAKYDPPPSRCWSNIESKFLELRTEGRIWFGKKGDARPRIKNYLSEAEGVRSWTWWPNEEVGHNQEAKKEINALFGAENAFSTPKPERLMQRILGIATNKGDLVLDSFLGSGTTAAVAHKMGRRWIGVEMGDHAKSHCANRLRQVVDGEQGGISVDENWKGGGGFRFCTLGPAIFDATGHIDPTIKFADLARHVWFSETKRPLLADTSGTILGIDGQKAFALLYNGILSDRTEDGGNVLTTNTLKLIREDLNKASPEFTGELVVFAAASRLGPNRHKSERIVFKQTPYDIAVRG